MVNAAIRGVKMTKAAVFNCKLLDRIERILEKKCSIP